MYMYIVSRGHVKKLFCLDEEIKSLCIYLNKTWLRNFQVLLSSVRSYYSE